MDLNVDPRRIMAIRLSMQDMSGRRGSNGQRSPEQVEKPGVPLGRLEMIENSAKLRKIARGIIGPGLARSNEVHG